MRTHTHDTQHTPLMQNVESKAGEQQCAHKRGNHCSCQSPYFVLAPAAANKKRQGAFVLRQNHLHTYSHFSTFHKSLLHSQHTQHIQHSPILLYYFLPPTRSSQCLLPHTDQAVIRLACSTPVCCTRYCFRLCHLSAPQMKQAHSKCECKRCQNCIAEQSVC